MAKFYGKIGYVKTEETEPGVWVTVPIEKTYFGDVYRSTKSWQNAQKVNDDINISAEISVVADPYLLSHLHNIRYVRYSDAVWEVNTIDPQYPRVNLSLGGLYNGKVAE